MPVSNVASKTTAQVGSGSPPAFTDAGSASMFSAGTINLAPSFLATEASSHSSFAGTAVANPDTLPLFAGLIAAQSTAAGGGVFFATQSLTLDTEGTSGELLLLLPDNETLGSGFNLLNFIVFVDNSEPIFKVFLSASSANAYFSNRLIDLGAIPHESDLTVAVVFDLSTSSANSGYGIDDLLAIAPPNPVRGDYLEEGHSQFLLENAGGLVEIGDFGSGGPLGISYITTIGPQWSFEGSGDYLAEGHDQFLIESTSGVIEIGQFSGGTLSPFTYVTTIAPTWTFGGSGDFLGDGRASS